MNALVRKSNEARATLMRECGLSELDYQLLILETGCRILEKAAPTGPLVTEEMARATREQLADLGFWTWLEYEFRKMEVALVEEWGRENAVALLQPAAHKLHLLTEQTVGLSIYQHTWNSYEHWLQTASATSRKRKPQFEHVNR